MQNVETLYIVETSLTTKKISMHKKLEAARQLQAVNVDVIELPVEEPDIVKDIAKEIKNVKLAVSARPKQDSIDKAWALIKDAAQPRIRLKLDNELLKDIDLHKNSNKNDLEKLIKDSTKYAASFTDDIEFVMENIDQLHRIFLYKLIEEAADSGAKTVTITDNKGYMLTCEYGELFKNILDNLPEFEGLVIGASCFNRFGGATASTLQAIKNGVRQVDVTLLIPECETSSASLNYILQARKLRDDVYQEKTNLNFDAMQDTYDLISQILVE